MATHRFPRTLVRSLADRLPELHVGDEWAEIPSDGDRVVIERIDDDTDFPFPMIHYRRLDGREDLDPRMGAPMFLFGKLLRRGTGAGWKASR